MTGLFLPFYTYVKQQSSMRFLRRISMRMRALPKIFGKFFAGSVLTAGLLAVALLAAPAAAKDELPSGPCFDGKSTIKEALDACQKIIDAGGDDKKLLIRAHSVRAMGLSATGSLEAAMAEINAAVSIDPK
ncbi:MAG: hypothetical protein PVJ24_03205, partial [Methyloceanibacter sp.]